MLVSRGFVKRSLSVLCASTFFALLGAGVGCSKKDDIEGDFTAEAVEDGLNTVLNDTVEPLASFLGAIPTIVSGGTFRNSFGGVTCPNTDSVCGGGGSVVCTPSGGGTTLTFDFDQCVVVTGDDPFTLDGVVIATPGDPILLTLNSLFINNHAESSGSGSVSASACSYEINVTTTDDASIIGTVIQCDADQYPTAASQLTVWFGSFVIEISFDGSSVAHSVATKDGDTVANCDINLAADPLTSSCSAP